MYCPEVWLTLMDSAPLATYDQTMGNQTVHLHVINGNVFGLLEASSNIAVYILTRV